MVAPGQRGKKEAMAMSLSSTIQVEEATVPLAPTSSASSDECRPSTFLAKQTKVVRGTKKTLFLHNNINNNNNNINHRKRRSQSTGRIRNGGVEAASPNHPRGRLSLFHRSTATPTQLQTQEGPPRPKTVTRRWRSDLKSTGPPPTPREISTTASDPVKHTRVFTVRSVKHSNSPSNHSTHSSLETPVVSNVSNEFFRDQQQTDESESRLVHEQRQDICATAILQHSYLELCGSPLIDDDTASCRGDPRSISVLDNDDQESNFSSKKIYIPDDPTVQESIECVFASQLGENLALMLQHDDDDYEEKKDDYEDSSPRAIMAPSMLQQSLLRNRSERKTEGDHLQPNQLSKRRSRKLHESLKLVHVGTYDPNESSPFQQRTEDASMSTDDDKKDSAGARPLGPQCFCCTKKTPIVGIDRWPQRPILLRPSPGTGTVVKGIRRSGCKEYVWKATSQSTLTWPNAMRQAWQKGTPDTQNNPMEVMCPACMVLPINNGNEAPGESLVIDFESELFEGTLLLRIRYTEGTTPEPYDDSRGYFHGMNRRYQAVIRGRFKQAIPFTECITGFVLDRPCGKLPPKWILKGSLKVLSFFAPQLQAHLDGPHPSSLTPLGSTPQVLSVHESEADTGDIEESQSEPTNHANTLLGEASGASDSFQRARHRKKQFDKLYIQKSPVPVADTSKIYTFEFLQHLFNFNDFSIELGSMLGSIKLKEILDGQPLQIMATHGEQRIWSFDIWHESLLDEARAHDKGPGL